MYETRLFIGGMFTDADSSATYDRLNPITNDVATRAAAATPKDAEDAANAAAAAFPAWSTSSPEHRSKILSRAADILLERASEFVKIMADETGAPAEWARFNCRLGAKFLRYAASVTDSLTNPASLSDPTIEKSMIVRQPAGVILGIVPWNAPVALGVRAIATPLACANTVILKASELCPKTHSLIIEILAEAGLPDGVANLVTNAPEAAAEIVEALISHAAIRRVNFTGSTRVGRIIGETCARHLKPCLLELSGKSPLIVLADADLDEAVKAAAFGAFFNQGQICMSTERIIVDRSIADVFVEKLIEKAATLQAGDPRDGNFKLGSMISYDAVMRVKGLLDDALTKGATLAAGGDSHDTIMQPTILDNVNPAMRIYSEESFGPVAAIIRVSGIEEAISVGNDTEYGLSAAVFSRDRNQALEVAAQLDTGACHINRPTIHDEPDMPFGGTKASGYGRFGGEAGLNEFTELRWISVHNSKTDYPV